MLIILLLHCTFEETKWCKKYFFDQKKIIFFDQNFFFFNFFLKTVLDRILTRILA
jgi:hypothetical protein